MARYIDADKLIEEGWRLIRKAPDERIFDVINIADVPTADVEEVRHEDWTHKLDCNGYGCYECSGCNTLHEYDTDYCPNCGAKMDGGKEE